MKIKNITDIWSGGIETMGFDVHGMNPTIHKEAGLTLNNVREAEASDKDFRFYELPKKTKETYFDELNDYRMNNPGVYFRNSIWTWHPLWQYINAKCDFLDEDDYINGSNNSGHEITKEKATKIAGRIYALLHTDEYAEDVAHAKSQLEDETEELVLTDHNLRRFADFCKESGGFIIC